MARKLVQQVSQPQAMNQQTSMPEPKRVGGGWLPTAGGILGGAGGGVAGFFGGAGIGAVPGAVLGAGAGAGAGYALENSLQKLLSGKTGLSSPTEARRNLATAGQEVGTSAAGELIGGGISKAAGKLGIGTLLKTKIPTALTRVGFDESVGPLSKTLRKISGEEAKSAAGQVIEKPTKQFSQKLIEKGTVGGPKKFLDLAAKELDKTIKGSTQNKLYTALKQAEEIAFPNLQKLSDDVMKSVPMTKASEGVKLQKVIKDKMTKLTSDIIKDGTNKNPEGAWNVLNSFRKTIDRIEKGGAAGDITGLEKRANRAIADNIRQMFRDIPGYGKSLDNLFSDSQFYAQLSDLASKKGAQKSFGRSDLIPLLIGGAVGGPQAAAGVGALKLALGPLGTTAASQTIRKGTQALIPLLETATRAGGKGISNDIINNLFNNESSDSKRKSSTRRKIN